MKDKLLQTDIMVACENIAKALRSYSAYSMACDIFIETRETKPEEGTDFVAIKVTYNAEDEGGIVFDKGERIFYTFTPREGEQIRKTVPVFGGYDNDPQS